MAFSVLYVKQLLTVDGAVNGLIKVTDASNYVVGALVYAGSGTVTPQALVISKIDNNTDIYCKRLNTGDYTYYNASGLLVADSATLTQPAQEFAGFNEDYGEIRILNNSTPAGIVDTLNFSGAVAISVSGSKANIFVTGSGPGDGYPIVNTYNDLPITVGVLPIDTIYVVKQSSGVWLINRKVKGLWIKTADTGSLSDWSRLGDWLEAFSDNNFAIYDTLDNSKQAMFDVGGLTTATTRLLTVPDASGTIALTDDIAIGVKKNGSIVGTRSNINLIEGSNVTLTVTDDAGNDEVDITINASGGGGSGVAVSAAGSLFSSGTLSLGNANGFSFVGSNGSLVGSYTVPTVPSQTVQTQNMVSVNGSTGNIIFSSANNVNFGFNGSTVTASATFPSQTVQTQGLIPSFSGTNSTGGGSSVQNSALHLMQANGFSFIVSSNSISGSYTVPTQSVQTQSRFNATLGGNSTSAGAGFIQISSGVMTLAGGNNVTLSQNGNAVTVSAASQTVQTQNMVSVMGSTGNISFSNANNVNFGVNGSTITASATFPAQTVQTQSTVAINGSTGAISFANGNNVSFGVNGSTITATASFAQTVQTQGLIPSVSGTNSTGGGSSFSGSAMHLMQANGFSFIVSSNSISGSYTVPSVPAQTNQTIGGYALGNTTGQSSSTTFDARTLSVSGAGIVSVGYSAGNLIISASAAGAGDGVNIIAAGTQTANTTGSVMFSNSNNVSFGMTNNSIVTASASFNQTVQTQNMVSVNGSTGNISFQNGGNVSFGFNASTVTATATFAQSVQTQGLIPSISGTNSTGGGSSLSGSAMHLMQANGFSFIVSSNSISGSYTVPTQSIQTQSTVAVNGSTGAISFANANNVSFGFNASTVTASASFAQSNQLLSIYAASNTTQASSGTINASSLIFQGAGIASVGVSNGSVVISVPSGGGAGDGVNIIAAGTQTANTTGTVRFADSNGIIFGMSNSSVVTASYTVTQTNQTLGMFATGSTAGQSSSTTFDARSFTISGMGGVNVGYSSSRMIVSGVQSEFTAGANITLTPSGSTVSVIGNNPLMVSAGTQSLSSGTLVFNNANGVTFGMSNNSVITASINPGAPAAITRFVPDLPASTVSQTFGALGNTTASAFYFPFYLDTPVNFNILYIINNLSFLTATGTANQTISSNFGIYSNNAGTLSVISSNSFSIGMTANSVSASFTYPQSTGTAGYTYGGSSATTTAQIQSMFGTAAGGRHIGLQFGNSMGLTQGFYWVGVLNRVSSSGSAIGISAAYIGNAIAPVAFVAALGQISSANTTNSSGRPFPGLGVYTSTGSAGYGGTALPSSVFLSGIAHTLSARPLVIFSST